MAYDKQTWVNKPDLSTPMSAARLNHMEEGIASRAEAEHTHTPEEIDGLVDEFSTLYGILNSLPQPPTPVTRTLTYTNGGQGSNASFTTPGSGTITQLGLRHAVRLFAPTTRWRIKLRNYNAFAGSNGTAALTGQGIILGEHELDGSGNNTGNIKSGTSQTLVSGTFTVPNNTSFYTSPWFTGPGQQLIPDKSYVIGWGFTCSAQTLQSGPNESFQFSTSAAGLNPATTGGVAGSAGTYKGTPVDFQIEYETTSTRKAVLWVGDSISEGVTGVVGTVYTTACRPCPIHASYPALWAEANNFLVHNIAQANSKASNWANASDDRWTRTDLSAGQFDAAVIAIGSNDIATAGMTLATFQTNLVAMINKVRSVIGTGKPIILVDVMPRTDYTTTMQNLRTSINDWLYSLPAGVAGVVRMSDVIATAPGAHTVTAGLVCDGVHPSFGGIIAAADAFKQHVDL